MAVYHAVISLFTTFGCPSAVFCKLMSKPITEIKGQTRQDNDLAFEKTTIRR